MPMSSLHDAWISAGAAQDASFLTMFILAILTAAGWELSRIVSPAWRGLARWAYLVQLAVLTVVLISRVQ
jgi:hypothetical protein